MLHLSRVTTCLDLVLPEGPSVWTFWPLYFSGVTTCLDVVLLKSDHLFSRCKSIEWPPVWPLYFSGMTSCLDVVLLKSDYLSGRCISLEWPPVWTLYFSRLARVPDEPRPPATIISDVLEQNNQNYTILAGRDAQEVTYPRVTAQCSRLAESKLQPAASQLAWPARRIWSRETDSVWLVTLGYVHSWTLAD
jgi:hypothetical protein